MSKKIENRYLREYYDLYIRAQKTGKYKVFLFDVVGSRKIYANSPIALDYGLIKFTNAVTKDLLQLEKTLGKKILHRHIEEKQHYDAKKDRDKVLLCKNQRGCRPKNITRIDSINPLFWMGDLVQFTIERDSIPDKTFYDIFEKNRKEIIPTFQFYHKSGYYETDVWAESDSKFSRIYCIPILEYLAKNPKKDPVQQPISEHTL
jgi:hypothetical protein